MKLTPVKNIREIAKDNSLLDYPFISEVIDAYNNGHFMEMKRLIDEYDKHRFFQDLYEMFDNHKWRSVVNKYLNFVGITIQYMKFMDLPDENQRPPSHESRG